MCPYVQCLFPQAREQPVACWPAASPPPHAGERNQGEELPRQVIQVHNVILSNARHSLRILSTGTQANKSLIKSFMLVFDKRAGVDGGEQTPKRKKFQIKSLSKKFQCVKISAF